MTEVGESLQRLRSRTVWQSFNAIANQFAEKNAFVAADDNGSRQRVTYRQLAARARNLSAGLAAVGVRRGDHVALWLTNTPEWIVTWFAALRIGAVLVPINTFYKPPEVKYVISHAQVRHLIMLDAFRALRMPATFGEICPEFRDAESPGFLCSREMPLLRNVVVFHRSTAKNEAAFDLAALETLGASSKALEVADSMERAVRPDDLGVIKYTSGSTGFPKGALLEQGGIVANAFVHAARAGIGKDDVFFSMMPFFHGGGSIWGIMTMMMHGGTLVFTEAFNAKLAAELLDVERATVMFGVLAQEVVDEAVKQKRVFASLWNAHVPNEAARSTMPNVRFTIKPFGLTEAYGPAALVGIDDPLDKQSTTCGRMLDGNECRVVDPETGVEVRPGQPGEARLKGNIIKGYWGNPEQTAASFDEQGWFRTGDLVTKDADGFVNYIGRIKLMIKVGGENVSLEEVENVVRGHPEVEDCGAVGVPDTRKLEVARAYVVLRAGSAANEAALHSWLEPRMARFKLPRDLIIVERLPKLGNGKLDRVTLREWARPSGGAV